MKRKEFIKRTAIAATLGLPILSVLSSCSEDALSPIEVDFTVLNASIAEAETLIATTDEGLAEGQYPVGSQAALQTAIDLAKVVAANAASTQAIVDNANIALQAAIVAYEASVIVPIDPKDCLANGTTSTIGSNHGHAITVSKDDVTAGVEKVYAIGNGAGHDHNVTITAANFTTLKNNTSIAVASTEGSGHTHSVTVSCA
jgi:hypothetical protein